MAHQQVALAATALRAVRAMLEDRLVHRPAAAVAAELPLQLPEPLLPVAPSVAVAPPAVMLLGRHLQLELQWPRPMCHRSRGGRSMA